MVQFLPLPDSDSRKAATFDDVIEVELYLPQHRDMNTVQ